MRSIEPGISRFPDAQLRICGLVLTHHPGMTVGYAANRAPRNDVQPRYFAATFCLP